MYLGSAQDRALPPHRPRRSALSGSSLRVRPELIDGGSCQPGGLIGVVSLQQPVLVRVIIARIAATAGLTAGRVFCSRGR